MSSVSAISPPLPPSLREGGAAGVEGIQQPRIEGLETETAQPIGFADVLGGLLSEAATSKVEATKQAEALARGATDDLHGTMIAVKEAEISMKLVGTIRNKLLDAFQELWRTNV